MHQEQYADGSGTRMVQMQCWWLA